MRHCNDCLVSFAGYVDTPVKVGDLIFFRSPCHSLHDLSVDCSLRFHLRLIMPYASDCRSCHTSVTVGRAMRQ